MTDTALRIALLGMGRMGREIRALAEERGIVVAAALDEAEVRGDRAAAVRSVATAEVALDFTVPGAAVDNVRLCLEAGVPVVVGTTGWYERMDEVAALVRAADGGLLWAANFSVGVAALSALARRAGELLRSMEGFDAHLVETHHAAKKDAPSGTGIVLARAASEGAGRDVPISSVRTGHVPGTHELVLDGPFEQLVLRHEARNRRVFADGALRAAAWLPGRKGIFTMNDVLGLEG
ncbi:MAG: 4-hydroxy-tetrahydrodipicolinate reductase [Gemmatimonadota bacterium]